VTAKLWDKGVSEFCAVAARCAPRASQRVSRLAADSMTATRPPCRNPGYAGRSVAEPSSGGLPGESPHATS